MGVNLSITLLSIQEIQHWDGCGHAHWSEAYPWLIVRGWRCTASLQCGCPQPSQCCTSGSLDMQGRLYSMACEVTWSESPSLFSMGINKVTCVWDSSWNGHRIGCQNCSCLWYYSKHIRDICQSAAESCTSMSCLHWGWWPSIWATVVKCKMVR